MRLRRSMLFVPGSNTSMVCSAFVYKPDTVMFDLEDSVAISEKDSARLMVFHALQHFTYADVETAVRVNPLESPYGLLDLEAVIRAGVDIVRLPKTDTVDDVLDMQNAIEKIEKEIGSKKETKLLAAIESALGVVNAVDIARCSKRLMGIALGAEDFVRDLRTQRTKEGLELSAARSHILLAARAAKINAFDSVFSDVKDKEGFIREVTYIKGLGFDGKSLVNPNQISTLHSIYAPTKQEIEWALEVIEASEHAKKHGLGVISIDGKMVDAPIIARAKSVIELAKASGVMGDDEDE
ncbi:MAG: citrate lyase subunit beta / citryl-CoA lyase [Sulfurospirillum sp.]|jgi:citrate lyase subunit beta/citryl-CoA lyase|nr:citrate lyase subunit beta / citryl-CoA lyase [Sulfurospirillum sp.]